MGIPPSDNHNTYAQFCRFVLPRERKVWPHPNAVCQLTLTMLICDWQRGARAAGIRMPYTILQDKHTNTHSQKEVTVASHCLFGDTEEACGGVTACACACVCAWACVCLHMCVRVYLA